jgi:hypothetical protein
VAFANTSGYPSRVDHFVVAFRSSVNEAIWLEVDSEQFGSALYKEAGRPWEVEGADKIVRLAFREMLIGPWQICCPEVQKHSTFSRGLPYNLFWPPFTSAALICV